MGLQELGMQINSHGRLLRVETTYLLIRAGCRPKDSDSGLASDPFAIPYCRKSGIGQEDILGHVDRWTARRCKMQGAGAQVRQGEMEDATS